MSTLCRLTYFTNGCWAGHGLSTIQQKMMLTLLLLNNFLWKITMAMFNSYVSITGE
jgi:hypothetical protein